VMTSNFLDMFGGGRSDFVQYHRNKNQ